MKRFGRLVKYTLQWTEPDCWETKPELIKIYNILPLSPFSISSSVPHACLSLLLNPFLNRFLNPNFNPILIRFRYFPFSGGCFTASPSLFWSWRRQTRYPMLAWMTLQCCSLRMGSRLVIGNRLGNTVQVLDRNSAQMMTGTWCYGSSQNGGLSLSES